MREGSGVASRTGAFGEPATALTAAKAAALSALLLGKGVPSVNWSSQLNADDKIERSEFQ